MKRILFADSTTDHWIDELLKVMAKLTITSVFNTITQLVDAQMLVLGRSTFSLALICLHNMQIMANFIFLRINGPMLDLIGIVSKQKDIMRK
jgi:hypothetical protein